MQNQRPGLRDPRLGVKNGGMSVWLSSVWHLARDRSLLLHTPSRPPMGQGLGIVFVAKGYMNKNPHTTYARQITYFNCETFPRAQEICLLILLIQQVNEGVDDTRRVLKILV